MTQFITQTVEQQPAILLIARPSAFSGAVEDAFSSRDSVRVVATSFTDFLEQGEAISQSDWYRIVILFQHPFQDTNNKIMAILSQAEQLARQSSQQLVAVMPLTSSIAGLREKDKPEGLQKAVINWKQQITNEHLLANKIEENSNISRFIFYSDLVDKEASPLAFCTSQLNKGVFTDPDIELTLQSPFNVASKIVTEGFRPQTGKVLIKGHPRQSTVLVEKMRVIFSQYHGVKLPKMVAVVKGASHPLLQQQIREVETYASVAELVIPVVRTLEPVKKETVAGRETGLNSPDKSQRLKEWNQPHSPLSSPKQAQEEIQKTSLRIPPNTPVKIDPGKKVKAETDNKSEMEKENSNELNLLKQKLLSQEKILTHLLSTTLGIDHANEDGIRVDDVKTKDKKVNHKKTNDIDEKTSDVDAKADEAGAKADKRRTGVRERKQVRRATKNKKLNDEEDDLSGVVNSIFSDERQHQKQQHLLQLSKQTARGWRKFKNRKVLFIGGLGVGGLAMGLLVLVGGIIISSQRMQHRLWLYIESLSLPVTAQEKRLASLDASSSWVDNQLQTITSAFSLPLFPQAVQLAEVSQYIVKYEQLRSLYKEQLEQAYRQIMEQEDGDGLESLQTAQRSAEQLFKQLSLLDAEMQSYPLESLSSEQKQQLQLFQQQLQQQLSSLARFQQLYPLFPSLFGQEQKRVYAVVLQNNQELRPTGGFIQAVGFLTFDQGKLINIQVEDVYDLDQQLAGVVSPPAEIAQYLGEERWFLRDSNWNPDFPQTAERISWFLDQSAGVRVDGVVAVNLTVLDSVLAELGQVNLPEYNEVLTERNIAERMEFHSEVQLIDDTNTPDYSQVVLQAILTKMKTLSPDKVMPLLSAVSESAQDKELLIALRDESENSSFSALGWSGALIEPSCPAEFGNNECVVDSIAQVEANVGVNKANYYLDRQIDHSIQLLPNKTAHKRVIVFKNKATSTAWPKGPYRAFTRFYLPAETKLTHVLVDGRPVGLSDLYQKQEQGRLVIGVLTETQVQQETHIELAYAIPHSSQTPFSYVFFDQKQPGARDVSPRIFLSHAPEFEPTLIAPQAEVQGDVIVFSPSTESGHTFVGATFE